MMKRTKSRVAAVAAALAFSLLPIVPATSANAATPVTTYVDVSAWAQTNFDVKWSVGQMDQYTTGRTVYGDCHSGVYCIKIYGCAVDNPSVVLAETFPMGGNYTKICVNSRLKNYGWWIRHTVMMHELGHALGLPHYNVKGNLMYPNIEGFGRTLTASQKRTLALW
jgi:hypothetical protein